MSKKKIPFENLFSKLSSKEIAMYIIETGRANGALVLENIVSSSSLLTPERILSSSFDFHCSVAGHTYWAKIMLRLQANKQAGDENEKDGI